MNIICDGYVPLGEAAQISFAGSPSATILNVVNLLNDDKSRIP